MSPTSKFSGIKLSEGRLEIVPASLVLLNPGLEGRRRHIWGIWAFDIEEPCDLVGAAEGRCLGPLMGYLSDRDDLWKHGRDGQTGFANRGIASNRRCQTLDMLLQAMAALEQSGSASGKVFGLAWAMFDMTSPDCPIPMGSTGPFIGK